MSIWLEYDWLVTFSIMDFTRLLWGLHLKKSVFLLWHYLLKSHFRSDSFLIISLTGCLLVYFVL